MIVFKIIFVFLPILVICSCSVSNGDQSEENNFEKQTTDSTALYAFFSDKISASWDYSPENDSVIFKFDEYGLPKSRSTSKSLGSFDIHLSIKYTYNVSDSTETVKHLQQYGGGHYQTVIRKFGKSGNVIWKEEIDVSHIHTKTEYDEKGVIISFKTLR